MTKQIPLTQGMFALVDDDDFERVMGKNWHASKSQDNRYYARSSAAGRKHIYLHRFIMRVDERTIQIDHRNHNTLDCRKENLRVASPVQNMRNTSIGKKNTSGYKGVSFDKQTSNRTKKWRALIRVDGKGLKLGRFETAIEAAREYDKAAIRHYGEFASTNFSDY